MTDRLSFNRDRDWRSLFCNRVVIADRRLEKRSQGDREKPE